MTDTKKYTIDTSAIRRFFEPRIKYEATRKKLELLIEKGIIVSHKEVLAELGFAIEKNPELQAWTQKYHHIFLDHCLPEEGQFIAKLQRDGFELFCHQKKQKPFHADPWLIAQASISNLGIVAEEIETPGRMDIPNIANHYGIECLTLLGLTEAEGWPKV